jgi:16S rRNA (cytosine1402-N4)-methyltransferase
MIDDPRFLLINENFRFIQRFLRFHGVKSVDGILADFGVSSHQFDEPERGFSIRFDAMLDMRMNQQDVLSAHSLVNNYEEEALRQVLWKYGELRTAPVLAKTIVQARQIQSIDTTFSLKAILKKHLPQGRENKILAQIYQAIRIEVNQEIEVLKAFLLQTPYLLKTDGRLSIISYHSLEDRLVKRFIRNGLFQGEPEKDVFGNFEVPFKKVGGLIVPTFSEIKSNNRARSAKLRIAKKVN